MVVLLALFLGWLWVHRMYLWEKLIWFLYLIFCWTFIPWIIAFCEIFYFAFMKQEDFDKRYNMDYMIKTKQYNELLINK